MIYEELTNEPLSFLSYIFLLFSIATLWISINYKVWGSVLIIALVLGFLAERILLITLVPIVGLAICFHVSQTIRYPIILRVSLGSIGALLSIALAIHIVPGFENWKILDNFALSEASKRFSIFLNFDKPLVGLFILGFGPPLLMGKEQWKIMLKGMLPIVPTGLVVVYSLSYLMKYAAIEIKFPDIFLVWALRNLFFTCVAEEALFRGLLQRYLEDNLKQYRWGRIVSLTTISILFGLAHYSGGINYILLATVAGLFYGYAFQKTKSIEASILTHFLLNTGHFIFFTYPSLL